MALDLQLRNPGAGTFDIALSSTTIATAEIVEIDVEALDATTLTTAQAEIVEIEVETIDAGGGLVVTVEIVEATVEVLDAARAVTVRPDIVEIDVEALDAARIVAAKPDILEIEVESLDAARIVTVLAEIVEIDVEVLDATTPTIGSDVDRVIEYGFEDFTGTWPTWPATTSPGAAYIFTCRYSLDQEGVTLNWHDHLGSCRINAGDTPRPAHGGTYYLHHGFCQVAGQTDTYLGSTVSNSVDTDVEIGENSEFPDLPHEDYDFAFDNTTDYAFIRFWFRLTDNWMDTQLGVDYLETATVSSSTSTSVTFTPSVHLSLNTYVIEVTHAGAKQYRKVVQSSPGTYFTLDVTAAWDTNPVSGDTLRVSTIIGGPGLKFIRFGAQHYYSDTHGGLIMLSQGSALLEQYTVEDGWMFWAFDNPSHFQVATTFPADLTDGGTPAWHCCCVKHQQLSHYDVNPNQHVTVWFDDWDCEGTADYDGDWYFPDAGTGITGIRLAENWCATYPSTLMGIDFDDIEIWVGDVQSSDLIGGETPPASSFDFELRNPGAGSFDIALTGGTTTYRTAEIAEVVVEVLDATRAVTRVAEIVEINVEALDSLRNLVRTAEIAEVTVEALDAVRVSTEHAEIVEITVEVLDSLRRVTRVAEIVEVNVEVLDAYGYSTGVGVIATAEIVEIDVEALDSTRVVTRAASIVELEVETIDPTRGVVRTADIVEIEVEVLSADSGSVRVILCGRSALHAVLPARSKAPNILVASSKC